MRSWPILTVAFGTLLLLTAASMLIALSDARGTYSDLSALFADFRNSQRNLHDVTAGIIVSESLLRDCSGAARARCRAELGSERTRMSNALANLRAAPATDGSPAALDSLRDDVNGYWQSVDAILAATPSQPTARSGSGLLARRDAVLARAEHVADLRAAALDRLGAALNASQQELESRARRLLATVLMLGVVLAAISIRRSTWLERRSEAQRVRAERAEAELRRLSQQLVRAQEDERRTISRELHDEVGQTLTALRIELRSLGELRTAETDFRDHLEESKKLAEQALRTVRNLAMLLRPAMLDDLGLDAALEWQAREHARRCGVPVNLELRGALDGLPDRHRTCVYRVLQEALTNCARHSRAREIRVSVAGSPGGVSMTIEDDGIGFDPAQPRGAGLGLIGIEERVRELGGSVAVTSRPGRGTALKVDVPVLAAAEAT